MGWYAEHLAKEESERRSTMIFVELAGGTYLIPPDAIIGNNEGLGVWVAHRDLSRNKIALWFANVSHELVFVEGYFPFPNTEENWQELRTNGLANYDTFDWLKDLQWEGLGCWKTAQLSRFPGEISQPHH